MVEEYKNKDTYPKTPPPAVEGLVGDEEKNNQLSLLTDKLSIEFARVLNFTQLSAREIINQELKNIPQGDFLQEVLTTLKRLEKGQLRLEEKLAESEYRLEKSIYNRVSESEKIMQKNCRKHVARSKNA